MWKSTIRAVLIVLVAIYYYLIANEYTSLSHRVSSNPLPDQLITQINEQEILRYFKNQDSVYIRYRVSVPPSSTKSRGIVFWLHGLSGHSNDADSLVVKKYVNDAGFIYAALDHQGMGGSGGDRGHVASAEHYMDDALAVLLKVKNEFTGLPIFLAGESMGGLLAAGLVERYPEFFNGVILVAPSLQINEDIKVPWKVFILNNLGDVLPKLYLSLDFDKPEHMGRTQAIFDFVKNDPYTYKTLTLNFAKNFLHLQSETISNLGKIKLPILFIHGTDDGVVPIDSSKLAIEAVSSSDKTLKSYEGLRHCFYSDPLESTVMNDFVEWIESHLK